MITVGNKARIFIDGEESNFYVHEFVTPETWAKWGARSIRYIEEAIVRGSQFLREKADVGITVCNHATGGPYKDSGTRTVDSYIRMKGSKSKGQASYLATYSMHKFCGAADLKIGKLTSHQMADLVSEYEKELMEIGIRRIENPDKTKGENRDWLHIDTATTGLTYIVRVNP